MSAFDPKRTSTVSAAKSTLLWSSFYDRRRVAVLYLHGFSVITGGLGPKFVGGCAVAHLLGHLQAKFRLSA